MKDLKFEESGRKQRGALHNAAVQGGNSSTDKLIFKTDIGAENWVRVGIVGKNRGYARTFQVLWAQGRRKEQTPGTIGK